MNVITHNLIPFLVHYFSLVSRIQKFLETSRFIIHIGHHAAYVNCQYFLLCSFTIFKEFLSHSLQALLKIIILSCHMGMSIQQNATYMLTIPHQNGIMAKHKLVAFPAIGIRKLLLIKKKKKNLF